MREALVVGVCHPEGFGEEMRSERDHDLSMEFSMSGLGLADSNDDSLKALNFILEAWEEGADHGIAPEMMAYAALYTALTDLVASFGEDHVVRMVEGLKPRVLKGEFTVYQAKQ